MLFKKTNTENNMSKLNAGGESPNQSINIISEGTKIKGEVHANGQLRNEG